MKRVVFFVFILILQINVFGQCNQEEKLIRALLEYKCTDKYEDSQAFHQKLMKLTAQIEGMIEQDNIVRFTQFKKVADSLFIYFNFKKSEEQNLLIFTFSDTYYLWNYVAHKNKIILKDNGRYECFYDIHNLNENEFLLIKRLNDMSFSYFKAFVYSFNYKKIKRKVAFSGKQELFVCSWTNVDESYPIQDSITGKREMIGRLGHYDPIEIDFDYKTKTISYSFTGIDSGKTIVRQSKYRNGVFNIKGYDAREFNE